MVRTVLRTGFLTALGLGMPVLAHAQGSDKALAEELFRQGRTLMQAQRYAEACPKLVESQRLDPGTGTLLNVATCHDKEGRTATAWAEYSEVITLARRDNRADRVTYAEEQLKGLETRLSRLRIVLEPTANVPHLTIKLDDELVGPAALGVAAPLDPGEHVVAASAPGKQPWQKTVQIPKGPSEEEVSVPALADGAAAPVPATTAVAAPVQDRPVSEKSASSQRTVAYVVGGVGVVGIVVGSIFGMSAISKNKESNDKGCTGNDCTADAAAVREDAQTAGNISTIAFLAGGAALAAGAVLFFTAPKSATPAASASLALAPGGGTLRVGGHF